MLDHAAKQQCCISMDQLSASLDIPVIPINHADYKNIQALLDQMTPYKPAYLFVACSLS